MFNTQAALSRADQFVPAKTKTAIFARNPLVREAFNQVSLDPQVRSLEFVPTVAVGAAPVALKAIVLVRDDSRFYGNGCKLRRRAMSKNRKFSR